MRPSGDAQFHMAGVKDLRGSRGRAVASSVLRVFTKQAIDTGCSCRPIAAFRRVLPLGELRECERREVTLSHEPSRKPPRPFGRLQVGKGDTPVKGVFRKFNKNM